MIDPLEVSTIRTGQLPNDAFSLTDLIPHEVGTDLKSGTVQSLADVIGAYIGASDGVGFRAVTITDGQTLPVTTEQEFILVGKGTFYNQSGGATLILTEELNAIVSNGSYWFVGVEIPVDVALVVTQEIRSGFTTTSPSENVLFDKFALYYTKTEIDNAANTRSAYNLFKFIQKGFGNTNLTANEIGDIFCGWKNDGSIRYSEAKWLGGSLGDSDNFAPLVQTEI